MKHCGRRVLSLILSFVMLAGLLPLGARAADANTDQQWIYEVNGKQYPLVQRTFRFPSMTDENNDIEIPFYYSDGLFANDPYVYNNQVASASLTMAMAGFYSNEGGSGGATGKNELYVKKSDNGSQFMRDIGCDEESIFRNDFNFERPGTDTIGVTIGTKTLKGGDVEGRKLIAVAVRGSNYEKEWASNVTVGEGNGEHLGFSMAATVVFGEIKTFIQRNGLQADVENGNVTFWISGFSRAGATSNLTAKRLVETYVKTNMVHAGSKNNGNQVFAYCNEAPQGAVTDAQELDKDCYNCIHSVINRTDLVPLVAPSYLGFKRYGVDHYIPGNPAGAIVPHNDGRGTTPSDNAEFVVGSAEYNALRPEMLRQLEAINKTAHDNFVNKKMDSFKVYGLDTRQLKAARTGFLIAVALAWPTSGASLAVYGVGAAGTGAYDYAYGKNPVVMEVNDVTMADFLPEFFNNLCKWTELSRDSYTNPQGNMQGAARDIMAIMKDSTKAQNDAFIDSLANGFQSESLKNQASLVYDLLYVFGDAFGKWGPNYKYKEYYRNLLVQWFEKTKCFDALKLDELEQERLTNMDLPALADLLLTYFSADYNHNLHGTNGMTQLMTFMANVKNIMVNHYPEVTLAWLRAQDTLYTAGPTAAPVTLSGLESVAALTEVYNAPAEESTLIEAEKAEDTVGEDAQSVPQPVIWGIEPLNDKYFEDKTPAETLRAELSAQKVRGYSGNGEMVEIPVRWVDIDDATWQYFEKNAEGVQWGEDSVGYQPNSAMPRKATITGTLTFPDGTSHEGVSDKVEITLFVAGHPDLDAPQASHLSGEYTGPQKVSLSNNGTDTSNTIYYTLDGSDPYTLYSEYLEKTKTDAAAALPENLKKYDGNPITIGTGAVGSRDYILIAFAVPGTGDDYSDYNDSDVVCWEYRITNAAPTPAPVVNPGSGTTGNTGSSAHIGGTSGGGSSVMGINQSVTVPSGGAPATPTTTTPATTTPATTTSDTAGSFSDVPAGSWYGSAVDWAVSSGVTNGLGDKSFGPDGTCTRAQMVTFLWRAAGSPEPKGGDTFTDVAAGSWYEKAVAWAVENGVTNGKDGGFDPNGLVTRAEAVTFLARAKGGDTGGAAVFTDVPAGSWYAGTVAWAVANAITDGMGDNQFQPNTTVTRAMAVTFLNRAYAK